MTIPWLMNCAHQGDGWCLKCVGLMADDLKRLVDAIRTHRDQRGDDRCFLDDETLYAVLPEGYTPPVRDVSVELALCAKYIASRHNPATVYTSPQRRIEQLEKDVSSLRARLNNCVESSHA